MRPMSGERTKPLRGLKTCVPLLSGVIIDLSPLLPLIFFNLGHHFRSSVSWYVVVKIK